jgi:hypothetical protein
LKAAFNAATTAFSLFSFALFTRSLVAHSLRDCKDKRALFPVQAFLQNIFKKKAHLKRLPEIKFGKAAVCRIKTVKRS